MKHSLRSYEAKRTLQPQLPSCPQDTSWLVPLNASSDALHSKQKTDSNESVFVLVGDGGFGPPKSKDNRFTVCPLWPLGKSPIYWSWWTDLNPRPADYKSAALPAELHQLIFAVLLRVLVYNNTAFHKSQAFFQNIFKIFSKAFQKRYEVWKAGMAQAYCFPLEDLP